MALKIRLSRVGTKNEPHYRVVVAEERSRRDGDAVEQIGSYNPRAKGNPMTIKLDRVDYWVSKGAKPTSTMHAMIKRARHVASAAPVAPAPTVERPRPPAAPVTPATIVERPVPAAAPIAPVTTVESPLPAIAPVTPVTTIERPVPATTPDAPTTA